MQNSKVDESVHNLLKLSLLMENGGIMINQYDTMLLGNSFEWVENMFDSSLDQKNYVCKPEKSFLFMVIC